MKKMILYSYHVVVVVVVGVVVDACFVDSDDDENTYYYYYHLYIYVSYYQYLTTIGTNSLAIHVNFRRSREVKLERV